MLHIIGNNSMSMLEISSQFPNSSLKSTTTSTSSSMKMRHSSINANSSSVNAKKIPDGVLKALDSWSNSFKMESSDAVESAFDLSFVLQLSDRPSIKELVEKDVAVPDTMWFRPGRRTKMQTVTTECIEQLSLSIETHLKDLQSSQDLLLMHDESFSILPTVADPLGNDADTELSDEEEQPRRRRSAPTLPFKTNSNSATSTSKAASANTVAVPTRIYVAKKQPKRANSTNTYTHTGTPRSNPALRSNRRRKTAEARESLPDLRLKRHSFVLPEDLDVSDLSDAAPQPTTGHVPAALSRASSRNTLRSKTSNCSKRSLYDLPNHLDVSQTVCESSCASSDFFEDDLVQ